MARILVTIFANELRLLLRDRTGLLLLFLMPAVLVTVVSLVQENIMKITGDFGMRILVVNRDNGETGRTIAKRLKSSEHLQVHFQDGHTSSDDARKTLADGEYQFCLIVPQGLSEIFEERLELQIRESFGNAPSDLEQEENKSVPEITVLFDPLVQGAFRVAVANSLRQMMLAMEMEAKAQVFSEAVPEYYWRMVNDYSGGAVPRDLFAPVGHDWGHENLVGFQFQSASRGDFTKLPTSVQQNVPAWALFGMFFIVVPLSGSLVRERQGGVIKRLLTLPVSYSLLLLGKAFAYVAVCLLQFGLISLIGKYILPLLGTQILEMGSEWDAILIVVLSASLAAAGYGIMVGTLSSSYEQASMLGAVSVVIAAALGGIMVPVYAMPVAMQDISRLSPLAWGLDALTGIFIRGEMVKDVLFETLLLLGFACATLLIGWQGFVQRKKRI